MVPYHYEGHYLHGPIHFNTILLKKDRIVKEYQIKRAVETSIDEKKIDSV